MTGKLSHALGEAAIDAGEAALNTGLTIAARVPILANCLMAPSAEGLAEWHEASSEKVMAVWEGSLAALSGWNDFLWRSLLSPNTPTGYAQEALVLARAISEPGHRRVKANAARLGGGCPLLRSRRHPPGA